MKLLKDNKELVIGVVLVVVFLYLSRGASIEGFQNFRTFWNGAKLECKEEHCINPNTCPEDKVNVKCRYGTPPDECCSGCRDSEAGVQCLRDKRQEYQQRKNLFRQLNNLTRLSRNLNSLRAMNEVREKKIECNNIRKDGKNNIKGEFGDDNLGGNNPKVQEAKEEKELMENTLNEDLEACNNQRREIEVTNRELVKGEISRYPLNMRENSQEILRVNSEDLIEVTNEKRQEFNTLNQEWQEIPNKHAFFEMLRRMRSR